MTLIWQIRFAWTTSFDPLVFFLLYILDDVWVNQYQLSKPIKHKKRQFSWLKWKYDNFYTLWQNLHVCAFLQSGFTPQRATCLWNHCFVHFFEQRLQVTVFSTTYTTLMQLLFLKKFCNWKSKKMCFIFYFIKTDYNYFL